MEYALIDKKFISISKLLELGFALKRDKIIYALQTLFQLFSSQKTRDYLTEQIKDRWNKISSDEEDIFLESFHSFNYSKSLKILKKKIESLPKVEFKISKEYFEKPENHQSIDSKNISILSNFKYSPYFEEAIELMIMAFNQDQRLFMDIYFAMKNWVYDRRSFDYDCEKELELVNNLFNLVEPRNYNLNFLLLEILDEMLACSGSITEQGEKPYSISIGHFTLVLTDGVKKLRKRVWEALSYFYEDETYKSKVESILTTYHWNGMEENISEILEFDYSCIAKEFLSKWNQPTLEQALIMKKLEEFSKNLEISIDNSFGEYIKNDEYKYYEAISPREYQERLHEWRSKKSKQIVSAVISYNFEDYKQLVNVAHKLEKKKLFIDFYLSENLAIALRTAPDELFSKVMEYYFMSGAPLANQSIVYDMLQRIGFDETVYLVNKYNFQAQNMFLRMIWEYLPIEMTSRERAQMLLNFIESQKAQDNPSIPRINVILKFKKFDENILSKVCDYLIELSKVNPSIAHDFLIEYHDNVEALLDIFQINQEQLEQLYLVSGGIDFDYDGELLTAIVKRNSEFWDEYTKHLSTKDLFNDKNNVIFTKIWLLEDYKGLIDVAFENIVNQSKKYVGSERYEMIFPHKSASNEKVNIRIEEWIINYIAENYENSSWMHRIFFHYICLQQESLRLIYLKQYLKYNKKFEDFKNLSFIPTSFSWSGSQVPLLERDITFLDTLLETDFLRGITFIDHRDYLESYKNELVKRKKDILIREFQEE